MRLINEVPETWVPWLRLAQVLQPLPNGLN
jgi:hypothetical protein